MTEDVLLNKAQRDGAAHSSASLAYDTHRHIKQKVKALQRQAVSAAWWAITRCWPDSGLHNRQSRAPARKGSRFPSRRYSCAKARTATTTRRSRNAHGRHGRAEPAGSAGFRAASSAAHRSPAWHASALVPLLQAARSSIASSSTFAPASMCSGSASSISLWLMPSLHGTKIMPAGATWAR